MKNIFYSIMLLGTMLFFSSCSLDSAQDTKTDLTGSPPAVQVNNGLPIKKVTVYGANGTRELEMEVAASDIQRQTGLMNRRSLEDGKGMLFIFDSQGYLSFWMKNTLISLDMIFVEDGGTISHVVHQAQPCKAMRDTDCPKYSSQYPARYVLEIGGGLAQKWGIVAGDRVSW